MVKKRQQLNLPEVYPAVSADFNLNTCGDPDCGNFGVAPDFSIAAFKGKNAAERRQQRPVSVAAKILLRKVFSIGRKVRIPNACDKVEPRTTLNNAAVMAHFGVHSCKHNHN